MKTTIQESYISLMSNKVKQFGGINLAQGLPGFMPPQALLNCLQANIDKPVHQYPPATGNFEIINYLNLKYKTELDIRIFRPLITCGATESISLLFTYLNIKLGSGYSALAFNPAYESYRRLPEQFNIPFIAFGSLEDQQIDFEKLTKTIIQKNARIIFVASPGNPHGRVFSKEEMDQLATLSLKLGFYLIIDAVYSDLYFKKKPYIPYSKLHPNIFLVNSFSKQYSITGWRIGYLWAHETHFSSIKNLHDYTGLCAPSILQQAIADFLKLPNESEQYIEFLRDSITKGHDYMQKMLTELGFSIPPADGGYFVWAKLPHPHTNGVTFANELYDQEKVAVVPGIHFSDDATHWIRINCARPFEELTDGADRIKRFMSQSPS